VIKRELESGSRVLDVLASFDFPPNHRVIVGVDGQQANLEDALTDGARIDLVPPIAGGDERTD
jgi:sulfur carrier protein ThiS